MQLLEILLKASPLVAAYFLSVFAWFGSAAAQEENCAVERHGYQCGNLSYAYYQCADGGGCCPLGWVCCKRGCCQPGTRRWGRESRCPRNSTSCGGRGCYEAGSTCCSSEYACRSSEIYCNDVGQNCCERGSSCCASAQACCKEGAKCCNGTCCPDGLQCSLSKGYCIRRVSTTTRSTLASTSEELEIKTSERSETWTTHGSTIHSVFRASHTIPTLSVTKIESAASTTAAATPTWTLIMNHIPTNPKNTAAFSNTELLENTCRGMKMRGKSQRDTLTRDSSGEKTKERRDAIGCFPGRCAEISRNKGSLYTCDEYPFASTAEGDLGVGLCIPASQSQWKSVLLSMKRLTDWPGIMNVRGGERFYINVMGMNCSGIDVRGPDTQLNPAAGAVVKTNASMFENTVLQPPYSGHHTLGRLSVTLGELAPGKYCFEFSMENGRVEQIMVLDNEGEDLATARHITTNQRHSLCFEVSEELDGVSLFVAAFTEDEGLTLDYELLSAGNSSFGTSTVAASGAVEVGVGVWWRGLMLAMLMGAAGCWGVGGNEDDRLAAARGLGRMVVGDVV